MTFKCYRWLLCKNCLQANDRDGLLQAANQMSAIMSELSTSNGGTADTAYIAQQSVAMVTTILYSLSGVTDVEQVRAATRVYLLAARINRFVSACPRSPLEVPSFTFSFSVVRVDMSF